MKSINVELILNLCMYKNVLIMITDLRLDVTTYELRMTLESSILKLLNICDCCHICFVYHQYVYSLFLWLECSLYRLGIIVLGYHQSLFL